MQWKHVQVVQAAFTFTTDSMKMVLNANGIRHANENIFTSTRQRQYARLLSQQMNDEYCQRIKFNENMKVKVNLRIFSVRFHLRMLRTYATQDARCESYEIECRLQYYFVTAFDSDKRNWMRSWNGTMQHLFNCRYLCNFESDKAIYGCIECENANMMQAYLILCIQSQAHDQRTSTMR